MRQHFKATMFVTLKYKDCNWERNAEDTKNKYLDSFRKNGVDVIKCELIKENKKSGRHDGYATGNYYHIEGSVEFRKNKELTRFDIFHACRGDDYFCVKSLLYNAIKFIKSETA